MNEILNANKNDDHEHGRKKKRTKKEENKEITYDG